MMNRELVERYKESLLAKENVVGVSRGLEIDEDGNVVSDEEVFIVTVKQKVPESDLDQNDIVPKSIEGNRTLVRDLGNIRAQNTGKVRPLNGGVSLGYKKSTTGTLGCAFLQDNKSFLLSNNHVIADTNQAKIGDYLQQPAHSDCEGGDCKCGKLERYVKLNFKENPIQSKSGVFSKVSNFFKKVFGKDNSNVIEQKGKRNKVDCALGELDGCSTVLNEVIELGRIKGIREPELGMTVKKVGRTSGVTEGKIIQMDATVQVNFSFGREAMFEDQIITTPISKEGDSGSIVLDEDNYLIGLLFSGSDKVSVVNRIDLVFELLNVNPDFEN